MRLSLGLRPSSQALRAWTIDARRARRRDPLDQREQRLARLLLVDADAAFDGDGNFDRRRHRRDAFGDQRRLAHQAGAEAAVLHAVGRAAAIEVDLVVAEIGADARRLGEPLRLGAAELQRDRMFGRVEAEQPLARAEHDRVGGDHLGIEPRPTRQQAMEGAAMPVRPIHHRRNTKFPRINHNQPSLVFATHVITLRNYLKYDLYSILASF